MRIRTGLAITLATLFTPFAAFAAEKVSPDLVQALGTTPSTVRILVRAKAKPLPAGTLALDSKSKLALRRQQATESRKELGEFLRSASVGVQANGAGVKNLKDLWIVNAYALETSAAMVEKLKARGDVEAIYLDKRMRFIEKRMVKSDGEAAPTTASNAWGVDKVHSADVWNLGFKGEGVVIGHIDTGVDGNHPAFAGRILHFKDFTQQNRQEPYDDEGHGTHTAGSIVGTTNGIGVAPGAKLIVAKALDGQGGGTLSGLLDSMQWMLAPGDGKHLPFAVSNSWGADREAMGESAAMFRDAVKAWVDAGIVPLFSSGNSGPGSDCVPGSYPEVVSIGALDSRERAAYFSTGTESEWDGVTYIRPDVSAPGVQVYSAMPGNGYTKMDGTSMACPHVAGVVALLKNAKPDLTVAECIKVLNEQVKDLGAPGKDTRFGNGLVDALKGVQVLNAR